MTGEILTGEDIIKLLGTGSSKFLNNIYLIYTPQELRARDVQIDIESIKRIPSTRVIDFCHDHNVIFIRINKEEQE